MSVELATDIAGIVAEQRAFFATEQTKDIAWRKKQLLRLKKVIQQNEQAIMNALHADLHKHEFEAYITEIGFVLVEIDKIVGNLSKLAKSKKVPTPLFHFKASSYVQHEPYGNTLIIAPWNYPFQLLLAPAIGALAAGNTAILKPSEYAAQTSRVVAKLINANFDAGYLHVVEGAVEETQALLKERFDYIFFTGGTEVGRIIYQAAAKHLTPVTLELGGKSPCIVDRDTNIELSAKRIVWGKFINAGQTCIAPDYILVDRSVKEQFVASAKKWIEKFFGSNPQDSDSYARIINERHFDRLVDYLDGMTLLAGGQHDKSDKFIAPTLVDEPNRNSPLMQEEIFGPILPVLAYDSISEAIDFVKAKSKPLALYIFSTNDKQVDKLLNSISAGGVTVNDTLMHIANADLPFGGVGDSGIGAYHGDQSFELFSHKKSVMKRSFLIDDPVRYAPYTLGLKWIKKLMNWTL